jgi:hypothetical protein
MWQTMHSKEEIFEQLKKDTRGWCAFLADVPENELSNVAATVAKIRNDLMRTVDRLTDALRLVDDEIASRKLRRGASERSRRRKKPRISLREFLKQPTNDIDIALEKLTLCTKSGASLQLRQLLFRDGKEDRITRMVNEAKSVFQRGIEPDAPLWDLFYITNGQRSSGFGWERPFLDEVFVMVVE